MQGSVQKRDSEIALWEIDQPENRKPKKSGRKRQDGAGIIDLYPDREEEPVRAERRRQTPHTDRTMEADRMSRTIELIGLNDRVSRPVRRNRDVELIGQGSRTADPVRRNGRAAESVRRNNRAAESVRRNNRAAESVRRNSRAAESVRRNNRAAESVRRSSRAAEPVRRRRPIEEEWDVEPIGQDWIEPPRKRRRRQAATQLGKRRKAQRRRAYLHRTVAVCTLVLCLMIAFMAADLVYEYTRKETPEKAVPATKEVVSDEEKTDDGKKPNIVEDFLEINDYSRPGTELPVVNSVFVHYTANPGTSARQNRSYFANLAETQERSASAHFIIGYEGEIVQCIPLDEQAYAVMTRNEDSISIECCYLEQDGEFTKETYDSLVQLLAWLKQEYRLGSEDILRHYDCGGKKCPIYYVEHEDAWEKLLHDVDTYIAEHGASQL